MTDFKDGALYLVFTSAQKSTDAADANRKVLANLIRHYALLGVLYSADDGQVIADTSGYDDDDLQPNQFRIAGLVDGQPVFPVELSTILAWSNPWARNTDSAVVVPKPITDLMTGVLYDAIESYDPTWNA